MNNKRTSRQEIEVELKIRLGNSDLEAVFSHFVKKDKKKTLRHKFYPRFYYDTEGLDLHEKGISLRVQYKPGKDGQVGGYEQTVKIAQSEEGAQAGTLVRGEYKDMLPGQDPDLRVVSAKAAKAALKGFKNKNLNHIFTAAVERRILMVEALSPSTGKKGMVEMAFDIGHIFLVPPKAAQAAISEIELEVKSGPADVIEPLRKKIMNLAPRAKVHKMAKSDRGVALYRKNGG